MKKTHSLSAILFLITYLFLFQTNQTQACTRAVYQGPNGTIITCRSMDWEEDIHSNLWAFPKGMQRNGKAGKNSITWTSKYGSVITSGYEIGTADGMNEKGLVANLLYLSESDYGTRNESIPGLTVAAWTQYVLDNFATVSEAVESLSKEPFQLIAPPMPNGAVSSLHLAISDESGDNAIFEYLNGKLVIHHSMQYQVMTNSPIYDQQLALNTYWKGIGGTTMLPGTNRAADRYVRASFYINAITQTDNIELAVAGVFSVIRNCSVPTGITTPDQPNISSTIWRTVSDQKNKVYYFESAFKPNTFWVNLKDIDFSESADVKKLTMTNGEFFNGNTAGLFKKAEPFIFMGE